jgi:energy-converting hydrogenase Eha subunit E
VQRTEQVRRNPIATYVGIALCVIGFALIAIAWNGAAELDFIQGQFPFFISGGLTGIGLIVVGATIMVIETMRRDAEIRAIEIGRLAATLAALNAELSPPEERDPGTVGEFRPRPRVSPLAAGNGNGNDQTMELASPRDSSWDAGS